MKIKQVILLVLLSLNFFSIKADLLWQLPLGGAILGAGLGLDSYRRDHDKWKKNPQKTKKDEPKRASYIMAGIACGGQIGLCLGILFDDFYDRGSYSARMIRKTKEFTPSKLDELLEDALYDGNVEGVRFLVDKGATAGDTRFIRSYSRGSDEDKLRIADLLTRDIKKPSPQVWEDLRFCAFIAAPEAIKISFISYELLCKIVSLFNDRGLLSLKNDPIGQRDLLFYLIRVGPPAQKLITLLLRLGVPLEFHRTDQQGFTRVESILDYAKDLNKEDLIINAKNQLKEERQTEVRSF